MSNVLDALLGRVHDVDSALANALESEIRKLQNRREYGLVYEAHAPEGVRLWGKKICIGDIVNVLPPRGVMETKDNSLEWKVVSINRKEKMAHVVRKADDNSIEEKEVSVDDLVAYADFRQTIYPGLVEVDRVERGGKDDPYHVVINGENFHALQAMLWCYAGKVDCIYIDPPYNTGAKDWKYNNDYVDGNDQYKHSKWLSFMEQRLKLAKKLLNPKDSVLIVTIDEKEYLRLGMLLEQMFPEARMQMISSVINPYGTQRLNEFNRVDEYIFFLMFGDSQPVGILVNENTSQQSFWKTFRRGDLASRRGQSKGGKSQFYPIYVNKISGKIVKIGLPITPEINKNDVPSIDGCYAVFPLRDDGTEMNWCVNNKTAEELLSNGYIKAGKLNEKTEQKYPILYLRSGTIDDIKTNKLIVDGYDNNGAIIAHYVEDKLQMPATNWRFKEHSARDYGTNLIRSIFIDKRFIFPKSLYAVKDCLDIFVRNKKNALIIDFFAGSGTTLHAVNLLNLEDTGIRKCICITNNEISSSEIQKFVNMGLRQGDEEWEKFGVAKYVTWERVKCSMKGIDVNGNPLKGSYLSSNIPMSEGFKENAIFFDLKYEDGKAIRLNMAFKEIAPLLWMKAGSKGRMIQVISPQGYDVSEQYAILFDFLAAKDFIKAVKDSGIKVAYIVTDSEPLYQQIYKQLPKGIEPVRLYENYLTSFSIYGAV